MVKQANPPNLLKYHGGKAYLAPWIISRFPPHLHYCEPYCGGCSVLFRRDPNRDWMEGHPSYTGKSAHRGCSELVNDIRGDLMNLWHVIRDAEKLELFRAQVACCFFDRSTWEWSRTEEEADDDVMRAVKTFIRFRMSRQGLEKDFATPVRSRTRGKRSDPVNAFWNVVDGLPEIHARLQNVLFECMPAVDLIKREDKPGVLVYCDPPYLHETRSSTGEYAYEMSVADHEILIDTLAGLKHAKFVLSGYPSELYDRRAFAHGWTVATKMIDNKASSAKSKEKKQETLWMNFNPGEK